MSRRIAHKVLAERIGERDPGNKPQVSDRIPYVYVKVEVEKGTKLLQGERIETPDYIRQNNLVPDYKFYISNQLMKPVGRVASVSPVLLESPERRPCDVFCRCSRSSASWSSSCRATTGRPTTGSR